LASAGAIAIVSIRDALDEVSAKFGVPLLPIADCLTYPAPPETVPFGLSAMVICPSTLDVTVAVVEPVLPAVDLTPVATPTPPPFPDAVPESDRSVRLERFAFVQPDHAAAAESLSLDAASTIKVLSTLVVTVPNVVVVEADGLFPSAITSHGVPVATTLRKVSILP
jgi:hypothetical protein